MKATLRCGLYPRPSVLDVWTKRAFAAPLRCWDTMSTDETSGAQLLSTQAAMFESKREIPEGFPDLVRAFAKAVLRSQPDDIAKFGSEYFTELMARNVIDDDTAGHPAELSGAEAEQSTGVEPSASNDPAVLGQFITELIDGAVEETGQAVHTDDPNRTVDAELFLMCIRNVPVGLTPLELNVWLSYADCVSGRVAYVTFVRNTVDLLVSLAPRFDRAKFHAEDELVKKAIADAKKDNFERPAC